MKIIADYIKNLEYVRDHIVDIKDDLLKLVDEGASFTVKNDKNETLLHYFALIAVRDAELNEYTKILQYAVDSGCKFTDQCNYGTTALHLAGRNRNKYIFDFAIKAGYTQAFNIQDKNGNTPLHWYCANGLEDFWTEAVKNGADPYIKNKYGELPHDTIATSNNLPAKFKKQFIKTVENALSKMPAKEQYDEQYFVNPQWKTPEKPEAYISLKANQTFEIDGYTYGLFYPINDKYAILNTDKFYNIINLSDGAIKHRCHRFTQDDINQCLSHKGIWYAGVKNDNNSYIVAIDPERGFDKNTGISLWMTQIGSSDMCFTSGFYVENDTIVLNTSASLIALNCKTGEILWKAKIPGRTEKTAPIIYNNTAYTQRIVRNKAILCAVDIKTGKLIENKNIALVHAMFEGGYSQRQRQPLVHNNKLYYLSQNEKSDAELVGINLDTNEELFTQTLIEHVRLDYVACKLTINNNILDIVCSGHDFAARFDINTKELLHEPAYTFLNTSYYTIVALTNDRLYACFGSKEFATVEIYNRSNGECIQTIKLPEQAERNNINRLNVIFTESGIIYTYRYYSVNKSYFAELCLIY